MLDHKEISEEYARNFKNTTDMYFNNITCFNAGYDLAQFNKWIKVEDQLPDAWCQHKNIWESDEVLLDCGDFFLVRRYIRVLTEDYKKLVFEGFYDIEDQEIVERWQKIIK